MLLSRRRLLALLGSAPLLTTSLAQAAQTPAPTGLPQPTTLPLYDGPAPGSESWTQQEVYEAAGNNHIFRNVTHPALLCYRPVVPNGTAVILVPGGAFYFLSMENEGFDTARKLLAEGFTVFILKYRLIATGEGWHEELDRRLREPGWEKSLSAQIGDYDLADAQAAIRLVRGRAAEFKIAPNRIGLLGFSAGGYVVTRATVESPAASRPDFTGCIYGVKPPELPEHASGLPPLFMVWADDDDLVMPEKNALPVYQLWKREGVPVEMHIFSRGGHGFGSWIYNRPSDRWLELFMSWASWLGQKG